MLNEFVFNTVDTELVKHNGKKGLLIRKLKDDKVDTHDVGTMYEFKLETGETIEVFEDELTAI